MVAPTVQLMRYNCSGTGSANITGMTGSVRATFDKLYSLYLPQGSGNCTSRPNLPMHNWGPSKIGL